MGTLEVELASVRAAFDLIDVEDVEAADELDNVARRGTALVATAGRLQGELDESEFGGLEAAVRDEARGAPRCTRGSSSCCPEASGAAEARARGADRRLIVFTPALLAEWTSAAADSRRR